MSETELSDLELRRRKLRYRAWHRGTREMDLLLGRFADAELPHLNEAEVAALESLIELPDPDLFSWLMGDSPVPPESDTPMFRRIQTFHREGKGLRA
jgi:antitoxin CptB